MQAFCPTRDGDQIGYAYIEELRPYETLLNGIQRVGPGRPVWHTVRSRDVRGCNREEMWNVMILDDQCEDQPFMGAWLRQYGRSWPFVGRGVHPELQRLCMTYHRHVVEVLHHGDWQDLEYPEMPWTRWYAPARYSDDEGY